MNVAGDDRESDMLASKDDGGSYKGGHSQRRFKEIWRCFESIFVSRSVYQRSGLVSQWCRRGTRHHP
jgi:hypothetical protein